LRYVFYEDSISGSGHEFWTEQGWKEHVQNEFVSQNANCPSLLCLAIPYESYVREDFVYIPGRLTGTDRPHYASANYNVAHYQFNKIQNPLIWMNDRYDPSRVNVITLQGTQRQCGNINGQPGERTENKGHHGIERPGVRAVRKHGDQMSPQAVLG